MKWVTALAALGLLAACGEKEAPPPAPAPVVEAPKDPECRTVTVFSSTKLSKPGKSIKPEWKAFSGVWGKAGWNEKWCHDLYVLKIEPTGKVHLMDTHGPGGGHDGSAFVRTGQLGEDNRLRFTADGIPREYWLEDGKLKGVKHVSEKVKLAIAMVPKTTPAPATKKVPAKKK